MFPRSAAPSSSFIRLLALSFVAASALCCGEDDPAASGGAGGSSGAAGGSAVDPIEVAQGCVGNYVDASAEGANRTIQAFGVAWTPPCLTIAAGQTVTWDVDFTTHPLRKGIRSDANAGASESPIPDTDGGPALPITFVKPGYYPFYCSYHATPDGKGMVGLVHVR